MNTGSAQPDRRSPPWPRWQSRKGSTRVCWPGSSTISAGSRRSPRSSRHPIVRDAAAGTLAGSGLEKSAAALAGQSSPHWPRRETRKPRARRRRHSLASALPDPACGPTIRYLVTDTDGRVSLWPNRARPARGRQAGQPGPRPREDKRRDQRARPSRAQVRRPGTARASRAGCPRPAACSSSSGPPSTARPGQRLLGWEDADAGKHGLGLMVEPGGRLHAILRNNGQAGDLVDAHPAAGFELVCVTWGSRGRDAAPQRHGGRSRKGRRCPLLRPGVAALRLGGPGSGGSPRFRGDLAEIRVYDRQLDESERRLVEAELRAAWLDPVDREDAAERPLDRAVRRVALGPRPVLARRGRTESDALRRRAVPAGRA